MSKIDRLMRSYKRFIELPWNQSLAGAQRVCFVVYDKMDERRIRARVEEFELATKEAGHGWTSLDLTDTFAEWMAGQEYKESYFESPDDLDLLLPEYESSVVNSIRQVLSQDEVNEDSVVAILGVACLFGFSKMSAIMQAVTSEIKGRLIVFFPGELKEGNNYSLLDARDGWNYLAVPITSDD